MVLSGFWSNLSLERYWIVSIHNNTSRPIKINLCTLRRQYYRSTVLSLLQVNVARANDILPDDNKSNLFHYI